MHSQIRSILGEQLGAAIAENTPILYGGSVKPENAPELKSQANIDGFLVGGASLKVDSFSSLCLG